MKPINEHPKVFISYAWGGQEYQKRVLALATELQRDGIEVLLDKWSLKEGHDTYAFMEQSVNDSSVTNVLLLLDPIYAKKANERSGGVGTETQIISPEIYKQTKQEKFYPVIMEREKNGDIPKPTYLKGILHFDLSDPEKYNEEYQRLVKRLYGVEIYAQPELGNMPKWVTEDIPITGSKMTAIQAINKWSNPRIAKAKFIELLGDLKSRVVSFDVQTDDYVSLYEQMLPFREEYLQMIKNSLLAEIEDKNMVIGDFLQELHTEIMSPTACQRDIKQVFLHEIFIYTIAILFKAKDYSLLTYLINRSFFEPRHIDKVELTGYSTFYHNSSKLDSAKCQKDNHRYLSGTAQLWIDNLAFEYCNRNEFVFADVLLSNYSFFGANYNYYRHWFPITYIYDSDEDTIVQKSAYQLRSREVAQRWAKLFGFDDFTYFRDNLKAALEKMNSQSDRRLGYSGSFFDVQLLTDFIEPEEIGTIN